MPSGEIHEDRRGRRMPPGEQHPALWSRPLSVRNPPSPPLVLIAGHLPTFVVSAYGHEERPEPDALCHPRHTPSRTSDRYGPRGPDERNRRRVPARKAAGGVVLLARPRGACARERERGETAARTLRPSTQRISGAACGRAHASASGPGELWRGKVLRRSPGHARHLRSQARSQRCRSSE